MLTFHKFEHVLTEEGKHVFVCLVDSEEWSDFSCNAIKDCHYYGEERICTAVPQSLKGLKPLDWVVRLFQPSQRRLLRAARAEYLVPTR